VIWHDGALAAVQDENIARLEQTSTPDVITQMQRHYNPEQDIIGRAEFMPENQFKVQLPRTLCCRLLSHELACICPLFAGSHLRWFNTCGTGPCRRCSTVALADNPAFALLRQRLA
jgi:hypothetical protein